MENSQCRCTFWEQVHLCQRWQTAWQLSPQVCHKGLSQGGLHFPASKVKWFTCDHLLLSQTYLHTEFTKTIKLRSWVTFLLVEFLMRQTTLYVTKVLNSGRWIILIELIETVATFLSVKYLTPCISSTISKSLIFLVSDPSFQAFYKG